jgi:hypothetical protein
VLAAITIVTLALQWIGQHTPRLQDEHHTLVGGCFVGGDVGVMLPHQSTIALLDGG